MYCINILKEMSFFFFLHINHSSMNVYHNLQDFFLFFIFYQNEINFNNPDTRIGCIAILHYVVQNYWTLDKK